MNRLFAGMVLLSMAILAIAANQEKVDFTSFGKAHIGKTRMELEGAFGTLLVETEPEAEVDCYYASFPTLPKAVSLMMVDGRLARIDVSASGTKTVSGAESGMTETELKHIYGDLLTQTPHAYTGPEGHYLTVMSPDGESGIRFETDGKIVTAYYAGTAEAIQYIEGCL